MKVWVAIVQQNEWETEPMNIGCYSTRENAVEAILDFIRENDTDAPSLSLETYDAQNNPHWRWYIELWYLDDKVEA